MLLDFLRNSRFKVLQAFNRGNMRAQRIYKINGRYAGIALSIKSQMIKNPVLRFLLFRQEFWRVI